MAWQSATDAAFGSRRAGVCAAFVLAAAVVTPPAFAAGGGAPVWKDVAWRADQPASSAMPLQAGPALKLDGLGVAAQRAGAVSAGVPAAVAAAVPVTPGVGSGKAPAGAGASAQLPAVATAGAATTAASWGASSEALVDQLLDLDAAEAPGAGSAGAQDAWLGVRTPVPEPGMWAMFCAGLVVLAGLVRLRYRPEDFDAG